jgi:glycine hydroxymethyltransferase
MPHHNVLCDRAAERVSQSGWEELRRVDPTLAALLDEETANQRSTLSMVASASVARPSVLCAHGSVLSNLTAEGYPGARYHPGAGVFDAIEKIAIERAQALFGATYANVQPHSCSSANLAVLGALLPRGGSVMSLDLDSGGHLTHGARASVSGKYYDVINYTVNDAGLLDYKTIEELALAHHPQVIIAGASAYPRQIDFQEFRRIADSVGAYLLADISHIAGLVAAGLHMSPVDHAHVTTTSTYKQLAGPRGGLILLGKDRAALAPDGRTKLHQLIQRAVFPGFQGTPDAAAIAAKARAFAYAAEEPFKVVMQSVIECASALSHELQILGYQVLAEGTDTHMVLVDLSGTGLTGRAAEQSLEECGILANRNKIPSDTTAPTVGGGLRFGTNILAQRGMRAGDARRCAHLVHAVLAATRVTRDGSPVVNPNTQKAVRDQVAELCRRFPVPFAQSVSYESNGVSPAARREVAAGVHV